MAPSGLSTHSRYPSLSLSLIEIQFEHSNDPRSSGPLEAIRRRAARSLGKYRRSLASSAALQPDADNHGQRSGLIHTEEVTRSIPVMPTQLHQAGLEAVVSSLPADCDQSRMLSEFPTTYMPYTSI
jgi:hypothetical protein